MTAKNLPHWAHLVHPECKWVWNDHILFDQGAKHFKDQSHRSSKGLAAWTVKYVYGRQNRTRIVRETLKRRLQKMLPSQFGLNFGAGAIRLGRNMINLDVSPQLNVDLLSGGSLEIPLRDSTLHLIVCQEVLEHVRDPQKAIAEFHRVLANGGELILQVPFVIGYHPGPEDLWRFTVEAFAQLLPEPAWKIISKEISVGHGTALHRILTEFTAVNFSCFGSKTYRLVKGAAALFFLPLVLFDRLTPWLLERDRIPGGYIVVAQANK